MNKVWITYAWKDNESGDVDYLAQELAAADLDVRLDRWTLKAGKRLWDQIDKFITSDEESDAWLFYATQNSLSSQPCKEEYAYALDRALKSRGEDYPIIAVFPSSVNEELIPAGIKSRLFISLEDKNWKERVVSAVRGEAPEIPKGELDPFAYMVHELDGPHFRFALEVRPRAGSWVPFFFALSKEEVSLASGIVPITACRGGKGVVPVMRSIIGKTFTSSDDGKWSLYVDNDAATPTQSYYLFLRQLPSVVGFGAIGSGAQHEIRF